MERVTTRVCMLTQTSTTPSLILASRSTVARKKLATLRRASSGHSIGCVGEGVLEMNERGCMGERMRRSV